MGRLLRIAIAGVDAREYPVMRNCVVRAGHQVALYAQSPQELIRCSKSTSPDLILVGVQTPGDRGLDAVERCVELLHWPVVAALSHCDEALIERANSRGVLAFVIMPVREQELIVAISVAIHRFQELKELRDELALMTQALEDRKVIERAKGLVMTKRSLEEATAYQYLQKLARRNRQTLADVARSLVLAEEVNR